MYNDIYNIEQYAYTYTTLYKWLQLTTNKKSISSFFFKNNLKRIAIYGVSGIGELLYAELKTAGIEPVCFVDKKAADYPSGYNGIPVIGINNIQSLKNDIDAFAVSPVYYFLDILEDLHKAGIPYQKIISLNMMLQE
ncbi:MAG: hypothetical protein Ta2B_26520 [Termitinemataceae bacterium]|nr:MAG: hypothetical protein Ta2B_26520 [Termitinemataceae bacterium]